MSNHIPFHAETGVTIPCALIHEDHRDDHDQEHVLDLSVEGIAEGQDHVLLTIIVAGEAYETITVDRVLLIEALGGVPFDPSENVDQQDCPACEWSGNVLRTALDNRNTENGYEWQCPSCNDHFEWEGPES